MGRGSSGWTIAPIFAAATLELATAAWAVCALPGALSNFDFRATKYVDCFRYVVRGGGINAGVDFGTGANTSLNITGHGGSAGRTWVTVVDQEPLTPPADNVFGSEHLCADILIEQFDNRKGAGI